MALIESKKLIKKYYIGKEIVVPALRGIDIEIHVGEFTTMLGPSGSGKTTLLNLIGTLDEPTSGTIQWKDYTIYPNGKADLHKFRLEKMGFIFQSFNLIPVLTAYENIEYPLLFTKKTDKERGKLTEEVLENVGLLPFKDHKPNELSGGQRQRVAIARALVNRPELILADEPTANLDSQTSKEILELMKQLNKTLGTTFLFATHDPLVVEIAQRTIQLRDGKVINNTDLITHSASVSIMN